MGLAIAKISFADFRSYSSLTLDGIGSLTVFVGPNAVGKTNIVEGVQLLTALASFRHATGEQLIRRGAPRAHLQVDISDGSRFLQVSLDMEAGSRRYSLNGKPKRATDLRGLLPAVVFSPDDLDLVKGSMSVRRAALDALGSQLSANYGLIKRDYEKVIRYKNRLLKDGASEDLIESINETLVTCGAQLTCYRSALFEKLAPELESRYAGLVARRRSDALFGECLNAYYVPSWGSFSPGEYCSGGVSRDEARDALARVLRERRGDEMARKRALVGPHADRIEFLLGGADAAVFGSQGQQRSIVLAFKLAEAQVIEGVLRQKPVLLLDDVMSELDESRRIALTDYMAEDVQTFITTTNLSYFDSNVLNRARIVHLPLAPTEGDAAI